MLQVDPARIEAAKANPSVFADLLAGFWQPLFGYLLRRTADVALSKDLTQETFLKAFQHFQNFTPRNEYSFGTWLYRIAANEANRKFRLFKRRPQISLDDERIKQTLEEELKGAEKELETHAEFLTLNKYLKKLKSQYQTVISLHYFEQMTFEEIAEILGKNSATIRTWHHRALEKLRILLNNETK